MSSTFTSRLKLERQASGANSGNWGNLVNYVLNRIDSSVRGYVAVNVAGSANVTLVSNNSTSNTDDSTTDDQVHNKVIEFTGALGANINVFTDAAEGEYVLFNNTTGSYTLTFGNTGHAANGVAITQGTKSVVYTTGTAMTDIMSDLGDIKANSLTSNSGATITGDVELTGNLELKTQKAVVFEDTSGGQFAALKANGTTTSYTLTLPPATGAADQIIKTDGSGNLSFADPSSGGTDWQSAVKTGNFTAVSGEGYFCNTAGGAFEIDLPTSPAVGDELEFVDFARSFSTQALTLDQGSNNFQGASTPKPVYNERGQAIKIVYSGATQGWIPVRDETVTDETPASYTAHFVVVAGGGGGGDNRGGGGGAGGYRSSFNSESSGGGNSAESALSLSSGTVYTITVGDGGAGSSTGSAAGVNGGDSTISGSDITDITSTGGGGGGSSSAVNGVVGGSGGGGCGNPTTNGAAGTANQGFAGANGTGAPPNHGGGGGGAGEAGNTDGTSYGGDGVASTITGASVTRGGGGGGNFEFGSPPNGGAGGGGFGGGEGFAATAGTANTGGGGGGGSGGGGSPTNAGFAAGSGVVILRVPTASYSGTTTGSPTESTNGSDTILVYNGDGSYTA